MPQKLATRAQIAKQHQMEAATHKKSNTRNEKNATVHQKGGNRSNARGESSVKGNTNESQGKKQKQITEIFPIHNITRSQANLKQHHQREEEEDQSPMIMKQVTRVTKRRGAQAQGDSRPVDIKNVKVVENGKATKKALAKTTATTNVMNAGGARHGQVISGIDTLTSTAQPLLLNDPTLKSKKRKRAEFEQAPNHQLQQLAPAIAIATKGKKKLKREMESTIDNDEVVEIKQTSFTIAAGKKDEGQKSKRGRPTTKKRTAETEGVSCESMRDRNSESRETKKGKGTRAKRQTSSRGGDQVNESSIVRRESGQATRGRPKKVVQLEVQPKDINGKKSRRAKTAKDQSIDDSTRETNMTSALQPLNHHQSVGKLSLVRPELIDRALSLSDLRGMFNPPERNNQQKQSRKRNPSVRRRGNQQRSSDSNHADEMENVRVIYPNDIFRQISLKPQMAFSMTDQDRSIFEAKADYFDDDTNEQWFATFTDKECVAMQNMMNRRRREIMSGIKKVPFGFQGIIKFNQRASIVAHDYHQQQQQQQQNHHQDNQARGRTGAAVDNQPREPRKKYVQRR